MKNVENRSVYKYVKRLSELSKISRDLEQALRRLIDNAEGRKDKNMDDAFELIEHELLCNNRLTRLRRAQFEIQFEETQKNV